jgi:hypothetical protein
VGAAAPNEIPKPLTRRCAPTSPEGRGEFPMPLQFNLLSSRFSLALGAGLSSIPGD